MPLGICVGWGGRQGTMGPWIYGGSPLRAPGEDVVLIRGKDGWVLLSARVVGGIDFGS